MADFNYKLSQSYLDAWRTGKAESGERTKETAGAYDFAYLEVEKILKEKNIPGSLDVFTKFYNKETGGSDPNTNYLTQATNWNNIVAANNKLTKFNSLLKRTRIDKQINYEAKSDIKYEIDGPEYQFKQAYLTLIDELKRYDKNIDDVVKTVKADPTNTSLSEYVDSPRHLKFIDFQNEFIKAYDWFNEQAKLASSSILQAEAAKEPEQAFVPTSEGVLNTESDKLGSNSTLDLKSNQIPNSSEPVLEEEASTKSAEPAEAIVKGNVLPAEPAEAIVKGNVLPAESAPAKTPDTNTILVNTTLNNTKESQNSNTSSEKIVNGSTEIIKSETSKSEKSSESNNSNSSTLETKSAEEQYIELKKELAGLTLDEDSTIFKSNKLADSGTIKKMLAPDKTLELSVGELSKTLPDAVNNLTTSFNSMSPQNSSSNTITNEGAKIDQSSNTQINQNPSQTAKNQEMDQTKVETSNNSQMTEYYMQAIYQALVSGKVKVRVDY